MVCSYTSQARTAGFCQLRRKGAASVPSGAWRGVKTMDEEADNVGKSPHEVGMDLDRLSVDELRHRIGVLGLEITRLEKEIEKKATTRLAAEDAFKL